MNYDIQIKPVAKGAKRKVTVSYEGKVIGERTSARPYRFALVVKRSQARALASGRENLAYQIKQQAHYRAIADNVPGARDAELRKQKSGFQTDFTRKCFEDGSYAKWADEAARQVNELTGYIARLESGPQPEFDERFVLSWHSARVPNVPDYCILVDVVEIPAEVA